MNNNIQINLERKRLAKIDNWSKKMQINLGLETRFKSRRELKQAIKALGGDAFEINGTIDVQFDSTHLKFVAVPNGFEVLAQHQGDWGEVQLIAKGLLDDLVIAYKKGHFGLEISRNDLEGRIELGWGKEF